jgi:hypothetical protein
MLFRTSWLYFPTLFRLESVNINLIEARYPHVPRTSAANPNRAMMPGKSMAFLIFPELYKLFMAGIRNGTGR